jgi:hypothetical protein
MTRINWEEVYQLTRLDEIIAYSIVTLQEAYTAPNNDDIDIPTKNDIKDWVRWEIAYDEQGRAFFRYAASLYLVDRNPLGNRDFLELINAPTKWLVNHGSLGFATRFGDTALKLNTRIDIPPQVTTMEKLLFWAIVLGDWWNQTLKYMGETETPVIPLPGDTPISNWGGIKMSPGGYLIELDTEGSTIDAQFDQYNGSIDDPAIPDFLKDILDSSPEGTGKVDQKIDLPSSDSGNYRENLTTCEEQDPNLKAYSQQQLDTLLPGK